MSCLWYFLKCLKVYYDRWKSPCFPAIQVNTYFAILRPPQMGPTSAKGIGDSVSSMTPGQFSSAIESSPCFCRECPGGVTPACAVCPHHRLNKWQLWEWVWRRYLGSVLTDGWFLSFVREGFGTGAGAILCCFHRLSKVKKNGDQILNPL